MKLNLEKLQFAPENAQTTGRCVFADINATVYYMPRTDGNDRENAGVSFVYEGGKFSAPMDPTVAKELAEIAERRKIAFTKVELQVAPASFGSEKRAGIKPIKVIALFCGKDEIYRDDPIA